MMFMIMVTADTPVLHSLDDNLSGQESLRGGHYRKAVT